MEESDMKTNKEVDQDILEAEKFCDECIEAFGKLKAEKGVGLFVQFASVQYAMLKRLESRLAAIEKSLAESRKETEK
jgi:hypothetical protein